MLVATPSSVTLAPEGGAHQSIATPLVGMAQDGLCSFEPAFLDELARHPRVRIDLDREVGREALIRTPFVNGADQVGLGGQHGCAEAFSARKGDAPSGASSFPSASARR